MYLYRALSPRPYPLLVFNSSAHHRDLHSFPTRRSSDLDVALRAEPLAGGRHRLAAPGLPEHGEGLVERSPPVARIEPERDRKSTRLNSSHVEISYAVFCLKKKRNNTYLRDERHDDG